MLNVNFKYVLAPVQKYTDSCGFKYVSSSCFKKYTDSGTSFAAFKHEISFNKTATRSLISFSNLPLTNILLEPYLDQNPTC